MFIRQNKMLLLWIMLVVSSFNVSSSNTVVTYTTKNFEELQCLIDQSVAAATWSDDTTGDELYSYSGLFPADIQSRDLQPKHGNFNYSYVPNTHFNLIINNVEGEDEGTYSCDVVGQPSSNTEYHITVEVIPGTFSLDCFVPPDITCPEQGVIPTSELICVCAANGVRPGTLYLDIPDAHSPQQNESIENGSLFDLRLKATVPVTESITEVTCSVKGYNTNESIPSELITTTFMISPPTCSLDISFDRECEVATLTCSCTASPTDGEPPSNKGMVYSFFNGTGHMIESETTTTVETNDVAAGAVNTYSCRGCNGLYFDNTSYVTQISECTITMVTTTEDPEEDNLKPKGPSALGAGAIVGISLGVVAVVVVIVVVAVIMCKKGDNNKVCCN